MVQPAVTTGRDHAQADSAPDKLVRRADELCREIESLIVEAIHVVSIDQMQRQFDEAERHYHEGAHRGSSAGRRRLGAIEIARGWLAGDASLRREIDSRIAADTAARAAFFVSIQNQRNDRISLIDSTNFEFDQKSWTPGGRTLEPIDIGDSNPILALAHIAAERGEPTACFYFADKNWHGPYRYSHNFWTRRALPAHLERMFDEGNGTAGYWLARYYFWEGKSEWQALMERAATMGSDDACNHLGWYLSYENEDYFIAADEHIRWFAQAASRGSSRAMYSLACIFRRGLRTPRDPIEAAAWFRLAIDHGYDEREATHGLNDTLSDLDADSKRLALERQVELEALLQSGGRLEEALVAKHAEAVRM